MEEVFYITTPIYYVNDEPHIGHGYTNILADVLARYARLFGRPTYFLTGTDEHGQKVRRAAEERGIPPQDLADEMVVRFLDTWKKLNISYDEFIRTTDERHVKVVQRVLQNLWEKGEIYLGQYEGWYCVPDERFWTAKDVANGLCPECNRPVELLTEPNYFFRMSNYQSWLVEYIKVNPGFIRPAFRRNEVLGFLKKPLGDLCISRPVSRMDWGIRLPFDDDYVTYVWFDALLNYITGAGYLNDPKQFDLLWPRAMHIIGKDILTTHCVYWPTMLHAAGLPQPERILAHGWWIFSGSKMSKSIGNVVKPLDLVKEYGVDGLRYYLVRDMTLGRDAEFSERQLAKRYEKELANDLGNLLHRLINMITRYSESKIPGSGQLNELDRQLISSTEQLVSSVNGFFEEQALNQLLSVIMAHISRINIYLEKTSPWKLAKADQIDRVQTILYTATEALRIASILLHPVMPGRTATLWHQIGWEPPKILGNALQWGELVQGSEVQAGEPLFPRIDGP